MFSPVTALGCLLRFSNERAVLFSHRMLLFLYIYLFIPYSVCTFVRCRVAAQCFFGPKEPRKTVLLMKEERLYNAFSMRL